MSNGKILQFDGFWERAACIELLQACARHVEHTIRADTPPMVRPPAPDAGPAAADGAAPAAAAASAPASDVSASSAAVAADTPPLSASEDAVPAVAALALE